jgi:hypothetical protein
VTLICHFLVDEVPDPMEKANVDVADDELPTST